MPGAAAAVEATEFTGVSGGVGLGVVGGSGDDVAFVGVGGNRTGIYLSRAGAGTATGWAHGGGAARDPRHRPPDSSAPVRDIVRVLDSESASELLPNISGRVIGPAVGRGLRAVDAVAPPPYHREQHRHRLHSSGNATAGASRALGFVAITTQSFGAFVATAPPPHTPGADSTPATAAWGFQAVAVNGSTLLPGCPASSPSHDGHDARRLGALGIAPQLAHYVGGDGGGGGGGECFPHVH